VIWWEVVRLMDVGDCDFYSITTLGKIFASVSAIAGIALIGMPTGILTARFSDALHTQRVKKGDGCGSDDI
jgi:voltage-gated potassium channel